MYGSIVLSQQKFWKERNKHALILTDGIIFRKSIMANVKEDV